LVTTMVWPFSSSGRDDTPNRDDPKKPPVSWQGLLGAVKSDPLAAAREWAPVVGMSLVGLGALQLYANYLRRIPGAAYVSPGFFHKRSLFGKVTSVGDGDGFRLFHTPGGKAVGWGWLRKVPTSRKELKDRTVSIRIAGIDAPECAHFGQPAQPYSEEAKVWLSNYILGRNVRTYVYRRDVYERIVASVYVRRWLIRRDVGLEMIKRGLATVYEGKTAAEFGGLENMYIKAEEKAKRKRKGMWSIKADVFESPRAYKTRWAAVRDTVTDTVKETVKP
jgi:endonuclease YncB( thermonuclease family)